MKQASLAGALRSQPFEGVDGIVAELGGMRFPRASSAFFHYADLLGLETQPFPNPLSKAAGSTVIEIEGKRHYAETMADLPLIFREVAAAYDEALEDGANFSALKAAIRDRDIQRIKAIWTPLVKAWDERTFYDFITSSKAFTKLSFHHREIFGQVGFGTGGWDSDFPNSMLEILRVNAAEFEEDQYLIRGGAEQVAQRLWRHAPEDTAYWPKGTSLSSPQSRCAASGGKTHFSERRWQAWGDRSLGSNRDLLCSRRHHPELAPNHLDRDRRTAVRSQSLDGARSNPLYAVIQNLRHGRSAILARQGPENRPRCHVDDPHRPPHPRHLSV